MSLPSVHKAKALGGSLGRKEIPELTVDAWAGAGLEGKLDPVAGCARIF